MKNVFYLTFVLLMFHLNSFGQSEYEALKKDCKTCQEGLDLMKSNMYKYPEKPSEGLNGKKPWNIVWAEFTKNNLPSCNRIGEFINNNISSKELAPVKASYAEFNVSKWEDYWGGSVGIYTHGSRIPSYCPGLHRSQYDCVEASRRMLEISIPGVEKVISLLNAVTPETEYIIELLGQQGSIVFPKPISSKPTSGNINIFDKFGKKAATYDLKRVEWDGEYMIAELTQHNQPSVPANIPGSNGNHLKLKPTNSDLVFVGTLSSRRNSTFWEIGKMDVVLGYDRTHPIVKQSSQTPLFTLVVNDKHANKKWDKETSSYLDKYSYGWYTEPKEAFNNHFRMVHIVIDELLEEVALYAFDNEPNRSSNLESMKVLSYPTEDIAAVMKEMHPTNGNWAKNDIISDLGALLINKAQLKYPSKYLGLKSSGHGSPKGIMNGFFPEQNHMRKALGSVKRVRGKNIDFLDFITNCNVSSFYNLAAVADNVDYVVASDLTHMSPVKYLPVDERPSSNYISYFEDANQTIPTILSKMVNKWEELFRGKAGKDYAEEKLMMPKLTAGYEQQKSLFDMRKMNIVFNNLGGSDKAYANCSAKITKNKAALASTIYYDGTSPYYSFGKAIPILYPEYTNFATDYANAIITKIDNRMQFDWGDQKEIPSGVILARKY